MIYNLSKVRHSLATKDRMGGIKLKKFVLPFGVCLLSGSGMFFIFSGTDQRLSPWGGSLWELDPFMIGAGTALIIGAVLLYINRKK